MINFTLSQLQSCGSPEYPEIGKLSIDTRNIVPIHGPGGGAIYSHDELASCGVQSIVATASGLVGFVPNETGLLPTLVTSLGRDRLVYQSLPIDKTKHPQTLGTIKAPEPGGGRGNIRSHYYHIVLGLYRYKGVEISIPGDKSLTVTYLGSESSQLEREINAKRFEDHINHIDREYPIDFAAVNSKLLVPVLPHLSLSEKVNVWVLGSNKIHKRVYRDAYKYIDGVAARYNGVRVRANEQQQIIRQNQKQREAERGNVSENLFFAFK